ncbi:sigma-70 family RNA polymerase sigma factor [Mycobacterium sp. CBMA293]|uniref:RNA polymerase sigma factor n=1 Tax=unclassified Mycolicibacterium TaxID=2636767 RepID=UPI001321BF3D|nr:MULTISPECIES: sigma-70 family RNA polymerase sigma factor [unclassified Mycolicibacterium]MUL47086.1 sigma-70 family RNA polymerase sigma factor [Mycolicibacterium sp. CBMA 360]MUL93346.1 sigma-70 family RNA polymerase sigma factor [Mycolicibacterium sp. CBMA 230]MUL58463.1 sigma-70 family RNA polymerase sigma factor [Mycolicibacterium sp. CBMA 335]MUL73921.1 sigma-70 family RNA polymerase sigma factor [Mycolicibacterium sp. CBMA 311]MUM07893.1 RNA polymerase subunit sigma-70 [Mycolicibacte
MIAPTGGDLRDADDEALRVAAVVGDREAFDVIVTRYGPALYRYARRMLAYEADVPDVVQDTFVAAWQQIGTFRGSSSLRTWLFAICYRKIADTHRLKRARPVEDWVLEPLAGPDPSADPYTAASNAAFLDALELALGELPVRQRAVWMMREVEQMTFPEIGEVLHLSSDAVRGHHVRALKALRVLLRRWQ